MHFPLGEDPAPSPLNRKCLAIFYLLPQNVTTSTKNNLYFKVCVFKGHRMWVTGATLMHTIISWIVPVQLLIFYFYIVQTCYNTIFQVLKPSTVDIFTPDNSKDQSQTDQCREGGQTKKSAMSK